LNDAFDGIKNAFILLDTTMSSDQRREQAESGQVCIYAAVWTLTDANTSYSSLVADPLVAQPFFGPPLLTVSSLFRRKSWRRVFGLYSIQWTLRE
jgi:hypothetical protein